MRSRPLRVFTISTALAVASLMSAGRPVDARQARGVARLPADELLDRYERGQWAVAGLDGLAETTVTSALDELKQAAPAWIRARGDEHVGRRRLAVATYLIELLLSRATSAASLQDLPPVGELIEWACALLREGPVLPAERQWHIASLGLLETYYAAGGDPLELEQVPSLFMAGALAKLENEPNRLVNHAEHGRARFPTEPSWALIAALGLESNTWPTRRTRLSSPPSEELVKAIIGRYRDAARQTAIREEALTRLGYFELRRGRLRESLNALNDAGTPADPVVRYWVFLFKGFALNESRRTSEAIAAYRTALQAVPRAQAATAALGALLATSGAAAEASAMLQDMLKAPPADPWILYLSPEIRFWKKMVTELRESIAA